MPLKIGKIASSAVNWIVLGARSSPVSRDCEARKHHSNMISPASPPRPAYRGVDLDGFANPTVFKRWPVIVDHVRSDLLQSLGDKACAECDQLVGIRKEIVGESRMPYLLDDNEPDCQQWNAAMTNFFPNTSYCEASWLFAECYLYRRIWNIVKRSSSISHHDVFHARKRDSLCQSFPKMVTASKRLSPLLKSRSTPVTRDLLLLSLWGNATDLSMCAGLTQSEMETLTAASGEAHIICNDLDRVCQHLEKLDLGRIDFILDNSGFELFGDLMLADYLHQIGVAKRTVFHCKSIPWFVSDTTDRDFEELLNTLARPSSVIGDGVSDVAELKSLAASWRAYLSRGEWVLTSNQFWSSWWAYCHLPEVDPNLFDDLSSSSLVFFKGDLNYRKLTYDCRWPSTTPFQQAIGDVVANSLALVALRTNKSDVCVGLSEGKEQELLAAGYTDWRWSGKFATVQISCPPTSAHCEC